MTIFSRSFPQSQFPTSSRLTAAGALLLALAAIPAAALGCSVCGCSLSSDWAAQGYGMMPGFGGTVRSEYYDNDDLRSGLDHVAKSSFNYPADEEVQRETLNRNTWVGLDYVGAPDWGISAQIPFYDRFHSTIAAGDTAVSESRASGLGDMRVMARYQKFNPRQSFGFQFGLKLPTGQFNQNFDSGPQTGELLDRGLQLGTGTTDLLAGVSYFLRPMPNLGAFAQISGDQPLGYRDGFIPSANLSVNGGLRYLNSSSFTPQLQVNLRWDGRERGVNADFDNSGDTVAYLSPGLTAEITHATNAFVFVQLPIYERVNGLQLEPRWLLSVGFNFKL